MTEQTSACATASKTRLQPIGDRVLLQSFPAEAAIGSILLPENSQQKEKTKAKVIATGPGKLTKTGTRTPMPVKAGETVLVEKYAGQEVKLDEEDFMIVRASEIIAIVEE